MELKIISFNLRNGDDPNGNSVHERAARLDKIISGINPDVIGFQEWRPIWDEYIKFYYEKSYEIFNKYRDEKEKESAPILWKKDKFNCIKTGYFWLSDTPLTESRGWDELYDVCRICCYVILEDKKSKKTFTFMNTHFGFGDLCQCASCDLIHKFKNTVSNYPTFIVGDFNMTPTSPGYLHMTKYFTDVNAVTANDLSTTYHAYHPEKFTGTNAQHIDYCFISDKIIPINQRIIKEKINNLFPSDHYGLEIVLKI